MIGEYKVKKTRYLMFLMVAIVLLMSACSGGNNNQKSDKSSKSYDRIISLMPSNTEILYKLGLGKKIVGVSTVDDYPKDVKNKKQFNAMKLNKEALLKAKPDLILAHESQKSTDGKVLKSLQKSGVKVVYVKDAQSLKETYASFEQVGKVVNREKQAHKLVKETRHNVNKVINSVPKDQQKKKVFMEVSSEPEIYTAGKHTFFDDMLTKLHAKNDFASKEGWKKVSKEDIIKKNPDVMISTMGTSEADYKKMVKQRGGFENINAVKHNEIKAVNGDQISRPGPRIDEGLKALRDALYK